MLTALLVPATKHAPRTVITSADENSVRTRSLFLIVCAFVRGSIGPHVDECACELAVNECAFELASLEERLLEASQLLAVNVRTF